MPIPIGSRHFLARDMAKTVRHHGLRWRGVATSPSRADCMDEPDIKNRTNENRIGTNEPMPADRTNHLGPGTDKLRRDDRPVHKTIQRRMQTRATKVVSRVVV
jgi:hypothetical protein